MTSAAAISHREMSHTPHSQHLVPSQATYLSYALNYSLIGTTEITYNEIHNSDLNIGPAAAVPVVPVSAPMVCMCKGCTYTHPHVCKGIQELRRGFQAEGHRCSGSRSKQANTPQFKIDAKAPEGASSMLVHYLVKLLKPTCTQCCNTNKLLSSAANTSSSPT